MLHMHRAAVQAKALWGSQVRGLTPACLRGLQASAAAAHGPLAIGASASIRLATGAGRKHDPTAVYLEGVVKSWAYAVLGRLARHCRAARVAG